MGILSRFPGGVPAPPPINSFLEGKSASSTIYGIAFGNGKFVAVGDKGSASYSADGINWFAATTPSGYTSVSFRSVAFGNGRFVAIGYESGKARAITSTNGTSWTSVTLSKDAYWHGICYGGNQFVAVGWGCAAYSPDGITWYNSSAINAYAYLQAVTYNGSKYVAVARVTSSGGSNVCVMYSTDGINWIAVTPPDAFKTYEFYGIAYGKGRFIAVGYPSSDISEVMTSTDGIVWEPLVMPYAGKWRTVAYADGIFVATCTSSTNDASRIVVSSYGTSWEALTSSSTAYYGIGYGNGRFVVGGSLGYTAYSV